MFSPCRRYRYTLTRVIDESNPRIAQVVGLNPSTADETLDDPTIRRCIAFARKWECGRLVMTNLFALRSTDPRGLLVDDEPDAIRDANDRALIETALRADVVVFAWGVWGAMKLRGNYTAELICQTLALHRLGVFAQCLGRTKEGHPKHPLYLAAATELETW